jgi:integrase
MHYSSTGNGLYDQALNIIRGMPRRVGRDLCFGEGAGPFSCWSRAKEKLDNRITVACAKARGETDAALPSIAWRLHDIRRTVATRLADLGISPHVIEAVLNHVSGTRAGVAGIYNRSLYASEKRTALALWGAHVSALVSGQEPKVVGLHA